MANEQNLVPFTSEQSREEAVNNGKKGGIASGQARREKIIIREYLEQALKMKNDNTGNSNIEDMTVALVKEALKGNAKAFEVVRDTLGQKPKEQVEIIEWDKNLADEIDAYVDGK